MGLGPLASPALAAERLVPRRGSASSCSPSARSRRPTFRERSRCWPTSDIARSRSPGCSDAPRSSSGSCSTRTACARSADISSSVRRSSRSSAPATVEDALDEAEALGQPYVGTAGITIPTGIVAGVGEPQTADRYRELAELANEWGAAATARGLRAYLHVHYWEFGSDPQTGESLFQILLDETDPRLVWFEPDLFWMVFGGIDPLDWIPEYQHRFPLFHVKDGNPNPAGGYFNPGFTDLGEGSIDFRRIFRALRHKNAHHYIVERDDQPDPARTARVGYEYLRNLRARKGWPHRHDRRPDREREHGRGPRVRP